MRFYLRGLALFLASAALIFFCSCERHHPDELPPEQQEKAELPPSVSPSPGATTTPAEFFPSSTPR